MRASPSLSRRCRHEFSANSRDRGERYHRGGRVALEQVADRSASGRVRGSGRAVYAVSLRAGDDEEPDEAWLDASCECPHFEDGFFCKHLWAFLLELDEAEVGLGLSAAKKIELLPLDEDEDDDFEIVLGGDDLEEDEPGPRGRPDPAWLRLAAAPAPGPRAPREIYYVVSLDRALPGSSLDVELLVRARSGPEGRLKSLTVRPEEIAGAYAPEDEQALRALVGCASGRPLYVGTGTWMPPRSLRSCPIAPGLQPVVLPLLARTGRLCRLPPKAPLSVENLVPLRWDGERACAVVPRVVRGEKPDAWQLEALLRGAGALRPAEIDVVLESGLAVAGDRIVRLEQPILASFVDGFRRNGPIELAPDRIPDVLERAVQVGLPPVELPAELGWSEETAAPRGRLEIRAPTGRTPRTLLYADVSFTYGDERFHFRDPRAGFVDRERRRVVRRDPERETGLLAQLEAEDLREPPEPQRGEGDVQLRRRRMPEHVAALLARGWEVDADGVRVRRSAATRLAVRTGVDWFDLEGEVAFDDQVVGLPELLAAAARGETTVSLGDGSVGLLPADWLARVAPLVDLGSREGDAIRFRPSQALLLDGLLAAQPEVDADAVFRETCRRLERAGRLRRARAPRGLRGTLRPYQKQGLGWLAHMAELGLGACLADDMGLGKTLQALALLAARREARAEGDEALPSLAVVPASLVHNWLAEAERFTPQLCVLSYTGPDRAPLRDRFPDADLVVTTYGTLRSDVEKLAGLRFDCVLLDEAQAIKNAGAQVSKAARLLRAEQRVALSGTPVENHLGELWALFDFLNPGMLGPSARRAKTLDDADAGTVSALGKALGPFILRRTKDQVLKDLPRKTEQTITCELGARERRLYRELLDHYRASLLHRIEKQGLARSKIQVLEALLRLRQAACHPGLVDPKRRGDGSAKLDLLGERLDQTLDEGHQALVFSQFTSLLALVRERLDAASIPYEYLDGRTRKRGERVRRFQEDPDCRVFLVSLKAGGQGLNLTAADYVFLLDPWWNPAVETQAIDRAHRIGQTRPVFAYRIVATDTIEEKILELQERKRKLADAIVSGAASGVRDLSREDLELLLG